jgi:hypothetical protein
MGKVKSKSFLIFLLIGIFLLVLVFAADHYKVDVGITKTIDEWRECKRVTNDGFYDIFVPTKTSTEWSEFRANYPAGIILGECLISFECGSHSDCLTEYPDCSTYTMYCDNMYCCSFGGTNSNCPPSCSNECYGNSNCPGIYPDCGTMKCQAGECCSVGHPLIGCPSQC